MGKRLPVDFYDDFANVEAALRPIVEDLGGRMPTVSELRRRGQGSLSKAIARLGGPQTVAKMLGAGTARLKLPNNHFDDIENVKAALLPMVEKLGGRMPTSREVKTPGNYGLSKAIGKFGGPLVVARMLGISTAEINLPKGHYDEFENVKVALLPIIAEVGGMPTSRKLRSLGLQGLSVAITRFGGPLVVAKMLGVRPAGLRSPKGYYDDIENVRAALRPIIEELGGRMPTRSELHRRGHDGLYKAVIRHGLDPVTQKTIEDRADRVARAYLALELEDDGTALWDAMARRWLVRDLDAALAAFEDDGTLDAFRGLLADP